ncbi:hypothetical protein HYC85_010611 [Camellia sinensis]|uniref:Uncharacterized protein n=1 Tax=Camellia sinensis TaxID=4442 RepID=A0A7J7HJR1_CAMSI|nr:hypothetical protein HYC85_010611 [Camellia sinensis]
MFHSHFLHSMSLMICKWRNHLKLWFQQSSSFAASSSLSFYSDRQVITSKILVDKTRNRVIFAESDFEFIDSLLSFLTLPLGKMVRLLSSESAAIGSVIPGSTAACISLFRKLGIKDGNEVERTMISAEGRLGGDYTHHLVSPASSDFNNSGEVGSREASGSGGGLSRLFAALSIN